MKKTFLKEIVCRWCGKIFYVCQSCWHGQAYCSDTCRYPAQKKIHNKAQERYRQTEKGKNTHAQSERRRRKLGQSKKNMDDASTTPSCIHDNNPHNKNSTTPCCRFCSSKGIVVEHFPHREYGGRFTTSSFTNYC